MCVKHQKALIKREKSDLNKPRILRFMVAKSGMLLDVETYIEFLVQYPDF